MKKFYLLLTLFVCFNVTNAQNIEWEKKVGGNPEWVSTPGIDQGKSVLALPDGTSVALINSSSSEGDFPTNSGKRDIWLFKLDASGGVMWKQRYGGSGDDVGNQVIATLDGGFIISGQTASYPGPDINAWIIKTHPNGIMQWNVSLGGSQTDIANSICQTVDGYVFTGSTKSNNGNLTGIKTTINEEDVWNVKLNINGSIVWNKIFGGFWIDQGHSIVQAGDGTGFAIAGFIQSNDRDVAGQLKGWRSALILKIDNAGTTVWKQTYGGTEDTRAYSIVTTSTGYAFAGTTNSSTGNAVNTKGFFDYLLVKIDGSGTHISSRTYGGSNSDFAYGLAATSDGGLTMIGRSDSPSGGTSDLTNGTNSFDSWVIKVDAAGNKVWDKNYRFANEYGYDNGAGIASTASGELLVIGSIAPGLNYYDFAGAKDENPFVAKYAANGTQVWLSNLGVERKFSGFDKGIAVKQAPDGSYYFLAANGSNDGDVGGLGKALRDVLVQKWDAGRNLVWQKMLGGLKMDDPKDAKVTPDGGLIIATTTYSTDGDMGATIGNTIHGDLWLVKLSSSGTIDWQKKYGGFGDDYAHSIELAPGGGYIIATHSWSGTGGDLSNANLLSNAWVIKVDAAGNKVWEKSYGGSAEDEANKIIATTDGGYAISGWTRSSTGDFSINRGGFDAFVIKFDANGVKQWSKTYGGSSDDHGDAIAQAPDGSLYLAGRSNSTNGDIAALATGLTYDWNAFVMKLSITDGAITWSKSIGGAYYDEFRDMITSPSGDPMLVLFADGGNGDFSENKGFHDTWIVKINGASGAIKWKKNYGGSLNDDPVSISRANNGGYLVAGVRNFDNMWDQLDFTANGEAYAIKVSDNEVHSVTITNSGPTTFCQGGSVTLTAVSSGAVSFQWYKNGTLISGANSTTYVANATGTYSVNATNGSGGVATASIDVIVNPTPTFAGTYSAGDIKQSITFGGYGNDNLTTFRQGLVATTDGGYIFTGQTNTNNDGDLAGLPYYGGTDIVVVKLDCGFKVQWKKTFGGSGADQGYAVIQTADEGYMVTAITNSAVSGLVTVAYGGTDGWLLKLDANGNLQWQKTYGGGGADVVNSITQTPEGDYIFVGNTTSTNGDLTGLSAKGLQDIWIVKINATGSILAQKRTGGAQFEDAYYVNRTSDGNYLLTGVTASNDGDITGAKGGQDGYVEKFSTALSKIWSRNYGGFNSDHLTMFKNTADGNYILSGLSVTGESNVVANGSFDYWALKLAPDGSVIWEKLLGSPSTDQGQSIETTADGGYVLTGLTSANGEDVTGFKGNQDAWVTRLDSRGNLIWQKTYGGSNVENGASIIKNNSGEFIVLSRAISTDGDLSGLNKGGADLWLTRIADCSSFTTGTISPASHTALIYETTFILTANAGTGYTYQWYRNNRIIAGATQQTYSATQTGLYKVQVTAPGSCSGYSEEVSLVFNNKLYVNDNNTSGDLFTTAIGSNSNSGLPNAPFATLQYAVSQAKIGDTVYVDAGTYAEQVIIDKGITISGAGQNLTSIITPSATLVPAPGPFTEIGLIETTQNIGDVHISDLSVTSSSTNPSQNIIIQSGGSVKNCMLLNGGQGIFFRIETGARNALVENNEIQPNGIGVNCQGSGLTAIIRNNNITKAEGYYAGIFAGIDFGPLPQLTIQNNNVQNYFGDGLLVASNNGNYLQNSIYGSGNFAINRFNNSGAIPNATCNWYGTTDAELIKLKISGTVMYAPWLTSGVDTTTARGFQSQLNVCIGRQNKFYVNDGSRTGDVFTTAVGNNANNGFREAPFATINYAMSIAQSGDTIIVDAGSYAERIIVNKKLYFKGAYNGINPGSSLSRGLSETIILPSAENNFIEMVTVETSNVIFDGFLFNGDNPGITGTISLNGVDVNAGTGIYNLNLQTDSLVIKNNIFKNFYRYAMLFQKAPGSLRGINITRNHIDNISSRTGRDGRAIGFFANTYGNITENTLTRVHNGVFIANHNVVSADSLVISSNTIEAYNNGVYVYLLSGISSSLIIKNNVITLADLSAWNAPGSSTVNSCTGINLQYITTDKSISVLNNQVTGPNTGINVTQSSTIQNFSVTSNSITQTPGYAISHSNAIAPLNANCNWYGSAAAQNVNPKVTESTVNHSPWLTNGTDASDSTGFQPVPNTCNGVGIDADIVTVNNVTCNGAANGSIDILMEEGLAPFTYSWSKDSIVGFASTEDLTNLSPGFYQLIVTDANGSTDSTTKVTITEPALLTGSLNTTNVSCAGSANGKIISQITGGRLPYTFLWSDQSAGDSLVNVGPGTYSVIVTDSSGCTFEDSVTITQPDSLLIIEVEKFDIDCNGANNGFLAVITDGGKGNHSYLWSNGSTEAFIDRLLKGTYSIVVTDEAGCTIKDTFSITEPNVLVAAASGTPLTSAGSDGTIRLTITGGTYPYDILWQDGNTESVRTGLSAGVYNAEIWDANGCFDTASYTVEESILFTVDVTTIPISCFNGTDGTAAVEVTGGAAPFTYLWSTGAMTASVSSLSAGTYTVTVTDVNGNTASSSVEVTQPATAVVINTINATAVTCFGGNDGTATASVTGGTGDYTYLWSNGATTATATGLVAGAYSVTVTDANGCSAVAQVEVTQPTLLTVNATGTNVKCNGGSDGTVSASGSGGTGAYTYAWSNGATGASVANLPIGTYTVTITDANGCVATGAYTVTQPGPLNPTVNAVNVTCSGTSNGTITVDGKGGTAPYEYNFNNTGYTSVNSLTGLAPSSNSILVRDANGCVFTTSVTITEPLPLSLTETVTATCAGTSGGAINITVAGGTPRYSFSWSGPGGFTSTREDITGLAAGDYIVTITDQNSCVLTSSKITVSNLPTISVTAVVKPVSCFGELTGEVDITVSPAGTYTFSWSGPNGYRATTEDIKSVKAATYTVTVTSSTGCTHTAPFTVTQPAAALTVTTAKTDINNCGGKGRITAAANGGTPGYMYSINGGSSYQSSPDFIDLGTGSYTITTKDGNGCTAVSNAISIIDNGSDPYEANERQTAAAPINLNSFTIARIAPSATDKDWFKFTTGSVTVTYTLTLSHPSVSYLFDVYDSRGRIIAPTTSSSGLSGTKTYAALLPNAVYAIQVRGNLSYNCYQLRLSDNTVSVTQANFGEINNALAIEKEPLVVSYLSVSAFPNPSENQFQVQITANDKLPIMVRVVNNYGQVIEVRKIIAVSDILLIGRDYRPGIYYLEAVQGNKRKSVKLIKQ